MLHSFIQKSKFLFGLKNESPVSENEMCPQNFEVAVEAASRSFQSAVLDDELLKRNEELRDAIYGDFID